MKTLTQDQIDAVIDWMNNWEQLKDTAIPLRFKEDWTKQLNTSSTSLITTHSISTKNVIIQRLEEG